MKAGDISRLKKAMLSRMTALLKEIGFSRWARYQHFFRPGPNDTTQGVYLCTIPHPMVDFDVVTHFSVRYNAIAEILNKWPEAPGEPSSVRATLGTDYPRLIGVGDYRWKIARDEDVEPAARAILEAITTVGFEFYSRFTTLADLICLLQTERDWWTYCLEIGPAMALPVALALAGRQSEVEAACRRGYEVIKGQPALRLHAERYPTFVKYISKVLDLPLRLGGEG